MFLLLELQLLQKKETSSVHNQYEVMNNKAALNVKKKMSEYLHVLFMAFCTLNLNHVCLSAAALLTLIVAEKLPETF